MFKKIFLILILFLIFNFYIIPVNATERTSGMNKDGTTWDNSHGTGHPVSQEQVKKIQHYYNSQLPEGKKIAEDGKWGPETEAASKTVVNSKNNITSTNFTINTNNIVPGGNKIVKGSVKKTVNNVLGTVIQKMMVAIGAISLLIMTIGAGYMIFYHGQDELLSKGKSIFNAGIIALIIALSSYYIVSLVRLILYSSN